MRKALPYLGASLSALVIAWSAPVKAQDANAFKDLDPNHWAYQAVTDLQQKGILLGYPDGYFRGKRTLTRYEFAIAIERLLSKLPAGGAGEKGEKGDTGPAGPPGPQGEQGSPGMTPDEVAELRRLINEFRTELTSLGTDVRNVNNRLDGLSRDVAELRNRLDRMIQWSGDFFVGVRSDRSRLPFADYSGALRVNGGPNGGNQSHFANVDAPHDFHLGIIGKAAGGITFTGDLVASNYLNYQPLGGTPAANHNGGPEQVTLYQAALNVPIAGVGSNTVLTVGRFKNQVTPLTYYRPDTDAYFDLPWYDDGNFIQDGFKVSSKFGSATTTLFAGTYSNLTTTSNGFNINAPIIGSAASSGPFGSTSGFNFPGGFPGGFPGFVGTGAIYGTKPIGFAGNALATVATQSAGIHVGIPIAKIGEFGATVIDFAGPFNGDNTYENVVVYGGNFKLRPLGRFNFSAEFAKSVTQEHIDVGDPFHQNDDNNAYLFNASYASGPVDVAAGYQYIDPRFGAPGYWNKIGNWINPTNVRGPFVRVGYAITPAIQFHVGGDFLEGARNRSVAAGFGGTGFSIDDNINRAAAGVRWNINKRFSISGDYEGVFYDLSARSSLSGQNSKPVEQYITFGAGLNLASNTVLKVAYQLINFQDVGGGFLGGTGAATATSNASVFTTQLAVHF